MGCCYAYVDGFNLYNGIRHTPHKWLDLPALAQALVPHDRIAKVRFCTAKVRPQAWDLEAPIRQAIYWQALAACDEVDVIEGQFRADYRFRLLADGVRLANVRWERLGRRATRPPSAVEIQIPEEKGSDVNLATHLVHDAHLGRYDKALVLSNDSDLVTPISIVAQEIGRPVILCNPRQVGASPQPRLLHAAATPPVVLTDELLAECQLPNPVMDAVSGKAIHKPRDWA